jgi:DNA (cytosine-5)-methyltransferase 1
MKHMGLFEGIGGFSLAARWMGWETLAWCEWNEFGQKVLRHHFPEAEGFGDIKKTDFTKYANRIDIITGGFPCQPYSTAGKRKGKEDERHLWPEMLRAIREVQPSYVVGENVRGLTNWNGGLVFDEVQADLEAEGYEVLPFLLPACAVNAPHRRDRIWFVAHSKHNRLQQSFYKRGTESKVLKEEASRGEDGSSKFIQSITTTSIRQNTTDTNGNRLHECNRTHEVTSVDTGFNALNDFNDGNIQKREFSRFENFPTQPPICGGNDGLPRELDNITFSKWRTESIKAYGNAIVPQIAYELFKAIEATD